MGSPIGPGEQQEGAKGKEAQMAMEMGWEGVVWDPDPDSYAYSELLEAHAGPALPYRYPSEV